MYNEFMAIIERNEDWFIAYCPEIPGANGQGRTIEECKRSLAEAIALGSPGQTCLTRRLFASLSLATLSLATLSLATLGGHHT